MAIAKEVSNKKTASFPKLQSLYGTLDTVGQRLAGDAPAAIATDAKTFAKSIAELDVIVQTSSTVAEVQRRAQASPALKSAANDLGSSLSKIVVYASKNC